MNHFLDLEKEISKYLIDICIDLKRKNLSLSPVGHIKYKMRDSLIYRMNAIQFHYYLLKTAKQKGLEILSNDFPNNDPIKHINIVKEIYYLFDDLIFNIASIFDYLGNFVGYIYLGESKIKIKWNGIVSSCFDKSSKIENNKLKEFIIESNKAFVNHLYGYRSDIIHEKMDGSESIKSVKIKMPGPIEHEFIIRIPKMLKSKLKYLKANNDDDITTIACMLVKKTLDITKTILEIIAEEIIPINKINIEKLVSDYKKKNENK